MPRIRITPRLSIDPSELVESFIHASGPGGQNVNKVATAVQLRFDVAGSPSLPEAVRRRLAALCGRRLGQDGFVTLIARRHRTQDRNRQDARARLIELLREAATPPAPRVATRPTKASRERRIAAKDARGTVKQNRRRPDPD